MSIVLILLKLNELFAIPTAHKLSQIKSFYYDCGYPRSARVLIILIAACPKIKTAVYSAVVADVAIVLMITLREKTGAFGASL